MLKKIYEGLRLKDGDTKQWTGRMDVSNKGGQGFKKAIGPRRKYSRSNFIKCPASGAGKVRQPGLMSQVGRVAMSRARKSVCSCTQSGWSYQYGSACVAAAVT